MQKVLKDFTPLCGLSLLANFKFWLFTLWLITLVLYSKRNSSITAPAEKKIYLQASETQRSAFLPYFITYLAFNYFFRHDVLAKTSSWMTTATSFFRQIDAGIGVRAIFGQGGGKPFAQKILARCPNFYKTVEKKRGPLWCNNLGRTGIWKCLDTVFQGQYLTNIWKNCHHSCIR